MTGLTLAEASAIVDRALEEGRARRLDPLTVAVLDAGGHLVALKREDGSGILRPEIALGKAWGALALGAPSRALASKNAGFLNALAAMSGGRVVPVPGGVLIRDGDGAILGAVGISGAASAQDEACAIEGVRAAGRVPDPAEAED